MRDVLVVVDMQNDFVTGALGTEEAVAVVPNVVKRLQEFDGKVIFTKDTHGEDYMETQEGKNLPVPHCIRGTEGHKIIPELEPFAEKSYAVFEKETFGSRKMAKFVKELYKKKKVASVELVGVCTDICVVSNALLLKAFLPELPVKVNSSCCAGVTPKTHDSALEVMRSCQIEII